jgi:hypothetical protein
MTIIEECDENTWQDREKFWITQFSNLTNHYDGGGVHYVPTTKEQTKAKISAIHKGKVLSEEQKEKIKKSMKKRKCSVDGIVYDSMMEASRQLNMVYGNLQTRLESKNFPTYFFI